MATWRTGNAVMALLFMALSGGMMPAWAEEHVASIDLCADVVVAAMIPLKRTVGLSPQARDPSLSAVATKAESLPILPISSESLVMAGADVVATGGYAGGPTSVLLRRIGVRTVAIAPGDSFPSVAQSLRKAGHDLGAESEAEVLAQDLETRAAHLASLTWSHRPVAAFLRPDGGTAGEGTFVNTILTAAGYRNLSTAVGRRGWTYFDLETLAMSPPEVIVTGFFDGPMGERAHRFGKHPVMARLLSERPVIDLSGRLLACGGWPIIEAAEVLAQAHAESAP